MVGGVTTDLGVEGGQLLCCGLPYPAVLKEPPLVWIPEDELDAKMTDAEGGPQKLIIGKNVAQRDKMMNIPPEEEAMREEDYADIENLTRFF